MQIGVATIYLPRETPKSEYHPKLHLGDSAVPDTSEYLPWILNSLNDIAKIIKENVKILTARSINTGVKSVVQKKKEK